jgi:hypothetical protein
MSTVGIMQARPPIARFERQSQQDIEASKKAGRTIYKDVDVVHIAQPPGRDWVTRGAVKWLAQIKQEMIEGRRTAFPEEWVNGFQRAYDNWLSGQKGEVAEGETPLKMAPFVTPAEAENYANLYIYSVEAAAAMTEDTLKSAGMGSRSFRDKCRAYLEAANEGGKVAEEVAELKRQLDIRDNTIAALEARLTALEAAPKRGRPAKVSEAA